MQTYKNDESLNEKILREKIEFIKLKISKLDFISLPKTLKIKILWYFSKFLFFNSLNFKYSMKDFIVEEPNNTNKILKWEIDWSKAPKINKVIYKDGHVETF